MTNQTILATAMRQSAIDLGCDMGDLCTGQNKTVLSRPHPDARKYLTLPFFCNLVSYGTNIVASVDERIAGFVENYISRFPVEHCFETPNLHLLDEEFRKYGKRVCFMAEYFLPDVTALTTLPCRFETRILEQSELSGLYLPEWRNALCEKRKELDVLAAAAYDGGHIIGLAGCSADCDTMWQIGIDVLPGYRRSGVASALTSQLALQVFERGKVPFYCAAWSNIASVRNAIKSGFRPAWTELTAIDEKEVLKLIGRS